MLITEHNDEGAMGIVLNRPATATVADAAPELEQLVDPGDDVYVGGPVQPSSVIVLAEWERHRRRGVPVFDRVGFVGAGSDPDELAADGRRARGCSRASPAGRPGSSRASSSATTGSSSRRTPDDVFTEAPEDLWSDVLERKGGEYALVARMPLDPSLN